MDIMRSFGKGTNGDLTSFYSEANGYLKTLEEFEKLWFVKTPLHAATSYGKTGFALEIMVLMPSLSTKLDAQGFSPLHLALKSNHTDTTLALARYDIKLVRVRGAKIIPLLQAAKECTDGDDHLRIIASFLIECPDSINFESAVHLVMKSSSCEAIDTDVA